MPWFPWRLALVLFLIMVLGPLDLASRLLRRLW